MNTTLANGEKIPWYRGRLFWSATIATLMILQFLWLWSSNSLDLLWSANAFPMVLLLQIVSGTDSTFIDLLGQILYAIIALIFIYLAFRNRKVKIFYALIFSINIIIGAGLVVIALGSL